MGLKIVGYVPWKPGNTIPVVPELLLVEADGGRRVAKRDGLTEPVSADLVATMKRNGGLVERDIGERPEGMWPCVRESSVEWFSVRDEARWRASEAQRLLESSRLMRDPQEVLAACEVAAAMAGQDLPGLVGKLRESQEPGESLADVYSRVGRTEK